MEAETSPQTHQPRPPDADTTPGSDHQLVQLFAAGFNAHGQLSAAYSGRDMLSFVTLTAPAPAGSVRLLHSNWCTTVLQVGSQAMTLGLQSTVGREAVDVGTNELFDGFGDQSGLLGCLDTKGRLWLEHIGGLRTFEPDPEASPLIGHVALAGNGKMAVTFKQAPNGQLCHILCFDDLELLQEYYNAPAEATYDAEKQHFMMQGQPRQLLAGTGTFLLRMESGEVYSWGDPRYSSLGRSIAEVPAERPGPVEALGGLNIKKIACGGWLNAALSEDGACYLWGTGMPGTDRIIQCLRDAGAGEVILVELPGENGEEPLDVLDVAVGENHVLVLAEGNRCFAAGDNKNGQLGLGHNQPFVDDWTRLALGSCQVRSIVCGPKSSFAFATDTS